MAIFEGLMSVSLLSSFPRQDPCSCPLSLISLWLNCWHMLIAHIWYFTLSVWKMPKLKDLIWNSPHRCAAQLLSENPWYGVGRLCYDHCSFLHCQPGCFPGVGPAWGAHHRHQWPKGVYMIRKKALGNLKRIISAVICDHWTVCVLSLSLYAAEKPIRQVHLRHSEAELCGHLLPSASGA